MINKGLLLLCILGILNPLYGNILEKAEAGDFKGVKQCVEDGDDINARNERDLTVLWLASYNGHLEMVKYLVEQNADTSEMTIVEWASAGWFQKVQDSIKNGADVNAKDRWGWTALIRASYNGYLEIAKYLVKNGADINATDHDGLTALEYAGYKKDNIDVVKYLESLK